MGESKQQVLSVPAKERTQSETHRRCRPREFKKTEYEIPTPTNILLPLPIRIWKMSETTVSRQNCVPHQYFALKKWQVYIVNVVAVPRLRLVFVQPSSLTLD